LGEGKLRKKNVWVITGKEADVAYFNIVSQHSLEKTGKLRKQFTDKVNGKSAESGNFRGILDSIYVI
jgi:hypothetical protein